MRKTSCTLAAIKILKKNKLINRTLIIAPKNVCYLTWPAEVKKWKDFNHLKTVVLHGPKKEERLQEDADIYLINPEGLPWLFGAENVKTPTGKTKFEINKKRLKALDLDNLVIDELSWFKNTNTNRFKLMKMARNYFRLIWGLTGDPQEKNLLDLFGQCFLLDGGNALGQYITHYRRQYFEQDYTGYNWTLKEGAAEKIYARLRPLVLSMDDEYLDDLPDLIINKMLVDLPEKAMKVHKEVYDDLISKIEDGTVSAANSGVASFKCRQIASGAVYIDADVEALVKLPPNKKDWLDIHNAKIEVLENLIAELQGSPLLVAYEFNHSLEKLLKHFGKDTPYLGKGVSDKRTAEIVNAWNKGEIPYLLGQPASMGYGLNLQGASFNVGWFDLPWSYTKFNQFNRRVQRSGNQSAKVFAHMLVAKDTIDEVVYFVLQRKKIGQQELFDALKRGVGK